MSLHDVPSPVTKLVVPKRLTKSGCSAESSPKLAPPARRTPSDEPPPPHGALATALGVAIEQVRAVATGAAYGLSLRVCVPSPLISVYRVPLAHCGPSGTLATALGVAIEQVRTAAAGAVEGCSVSSVPPPTFCTLSLSRCSALSLCACRSHHHTSRSRSLGPFGVWPTGLGVAIEQVCAVAERTAYRRRESVLSSP
jgi:hypothetical protein